MTITPPVSQNHPKPNITVMNRMEGKNSLVEVLYYNSLHGSEDITGAQQLYFAQQVGLRLKQVRISLNNGEGLLQTFSGTGEVWLAPTQTIYDRLRTQGLTALVRPQASMGQNPK